MKTRIEDKTIFYENEKVCVFLSSNPVVKGHCVLTWKNFVFSDVNQLQGQEKEDFDKAILRIKKALLMVYPGKKIYFEFMVENRAIVCHLIPLDRDQDEKSFVNLSPDKKLVDFAQIPMLKFLLH